jgi:uncharacterized damage-inducible protein DinB
MAYDFLLDTYETEILKTTGIWRTFPDSAMDFRPHPKSRSVIEQMDHQVQSEGRWMKVMLDVDTGDFSPAERSKRGFIEKYKSDAGRRLEIMRGKPDEWWSEMTNFFDVVRSRAWVVTRRINHSTHHRGMLIVYLRLLDIPVPSVYGPTADTGDSVTYALDR